MTKKDDRTEEQKQTHTIAVVARDAGMSGWGGAKGGASRCAWACSDRNIADRIEKWVSDRDEMRNITIVDLRTYRVPSGTAHFHIYIVNPETHPAFERVPLNA
jgi:hypothetical protein